jgi:glycosyltransferase involved in cell wall biosynthesis
MKIAFAVLRYGDNILGGAEYLARLVAEHLAQSGLAEIDVLTTAASLHYAPSNNLPTGISWLNGVRILRFPIDLTAFDMQVYQQLMWYQYYEPHGIPLERQNDWARNMTFSAAMCAYLDAYQAEYDAIIIVPYINSLHAAMVAPHKTYIWPCMHDEPPAYAVPVMRMLNAARGVIFNSEPELAVARRLGLHNSNVGVVALGIDPLDGSRARFYAQTPLAPPFIVYAGRLEDSKNIAELYAFFEEYKRQFPGDLCLRLLGKGPEQPPARPDIIAEGYVPSQRKADVFASAVAVVAPSIAESLSLTLLEAWTLATPSIVNGRCEVMRYQVERCQGGLHYSSQSEFNHAINTYACNEETRRQAGAAGRDFVRRRYNWQRVLSDFMRLVN